MASLVCGQLIAEVNLQNTPKSPNRPASDVAIHGVTLGGFPKKSKRSKLMMGYFWGPLPYQNQVVFKIIHRADF
jgi:hypothetical protein